MDKDSVTRPLVDALMTELTGDPGDRQSEEYLRSVRSREYECMLDTALDIIEGGVPTVVVAPFLKELTCPEWWEGFKTSASKRGAQTIGVWVECSDTNEHRRRITSRAAERDRWKFENWDEFVSNLNSDPVHGAVRIDMAGVSLKYLDILAEKLSAELML